MMRKTRLRKAVFDRPQSAAAIEWNPQTVSTGTGLPVRQRVRWSVLSIGLSLFMLGASMFNSPGCQAAEGGPQEQHLASTQLKVLMQSTNNAPLAADLEKLERRYPRTEAASLARFLRGYGAFAKGDAATAISALDPREFPSGFLLRDYVLYYRALALSSAQRHGEAFEAFDEIRKKHADSPLGSQAIVKAAAETLAAGKAADAIKYLAQHGQQSSGALAVIGQAEEKLENNREAIAAYRKLYFEMPNSAEAGFAESRLPALGADPQSPASATPEERMQRAERLYAAGNLLLAMKAFSEISAATSEQVPSPNLYHLHFGASLIVGGQLKAAIEQLQAVRPAPAGSKEINMEPEALFHLAEAFRKLKQSAPASNALRTLQSRYPKDAMTLHTLFAVAKSALRDGNDAAAAEHYRPIAARFAGTPEALEASYWLAWRDHQNGNLKQAAEELMKHVADYRDTDYRAKAAFWAAIDFERTGQAAVALSLHKQIIVRYEYSYYGGASHDHIARIEKEHKGIVPATPAPHSALAKALANIFRPEPPKEAASPAADSQVSRAQALHTIALDDFAFSEIEVERRKTPDSPKLNLAAARIFADRGEPVAALNELKKAYPDYPYYEDSALPKEAWEVFFPLSSWQQIKAEAAKYSLDPYLIAGLIRQETIFDPRAVSRANARGLMQILPSTGRMIAKKHGLSAFSAGDLFDPSLNIRLGAAFFADLSRQFGKVEYAAAAYNGGPSRVQRWIKQLPNDSMEDWVESIPITETRLYVQGVLRNAANYRRFYNENGSFNTSILGQ